MFKRKSVAKCWGKDSFYRHLNDESINWRSIQYEFAKVFISKVQQNVEKSTTVLPSCLICDDTTLVKTGKTIEGISRVFDHTMHYIYCSYISASIQYSISQNAKE